MGSPNFFLHPLMRAHIAMVLLGCALVFVGSGCGQSTDLPAAVPTFLRAADLSSIPMIESRGGMVFTSHGEPVDMLELLAAAGINTIRVRLWYEPSNEASGIAEVMALANRIKARGMAVWLCIHYSNTWADPGSQATPPAWAGLTMDALEDSVYSYTARAVQQVQPDFIQIGNEVNNGMLFPMGNRWTQSAQFRRLLAAGIQATRDTRPATKTMLHFAGYENAPAFFSQYGNLDVDIFGLSYYPWWHGKEMENLFAVLSALAENNDRDVMVAETAYPFSLEFADFTNNIVGLESQLVLPDYPATPAGQAAFVGDLTAGVKAIPRGVGVAYWGGEWIAFDGPTSTQGSPLENVALFDFDFHLLPVALALGMQ